MDEGMKEETNRVVKLEPGPSRRRNESSSSSSSFAAPIMSNKSKTTKIQPSSGSKSKGGTTSSNKVDAKAKLERSRQSARECRARKKLRYQYLEELVSKREKAVMLLHKELESNRELFKQVESGKKPIDSLKSILNESSS